MGSLRTSGTSLILTLFFELDSVLFFEVDSLVLLIDLKDPFYIYYEVLEDVSVFFNTEEGCDYSVDIY